MSMLGLGLSLLRYTGTTFKDLFYQNFLHEDNSVIQCEDTGYLLLESD